MVLNFADRAAKSYRLHCSSRKILHNLQNQFEIQCVPVCQIQEIQLDFNL